MSRTHFLFFFSLSRLVSHSGVFLPCAAASRSSVEKEYERTEAGEVDRWRFPQFFYAAARMHRHAVFQSLGCGLTVPRPSSRLSCSFSFFFFLHPCIKKKKKIIAVMLLLFYRLLHFTFCFSSRFPRLVLISFLFFFFCVCVYDYIRATSQSFSIDKKETPFFFWVCLSRPGLI